jgi:hypothetical protein
LSESVFVAMSNGVVRPEFPKTPGSKLRPEALSKLEVKKRLDIH